MLQGPVQQVFLFDRLGREFGIDARTAEKEQFFNTILVCRMNDVGGDHEIVVDKLGAIGIIGENAADFGSGNNNHLGPFLSEKSFAVLLPAQIQLLQVTGDNAAATACLKQPVEGGTDQTSMSSEIDFFIS